MQNSSRPIDRIGPVRFDEVRAVGDVVTTALREAVLAGRFEPGERLVQDQLAAALCVSRQPVREALRRLESDGLVTQLPRRGATVRKYSNADIEENYFLRKILEAEAARAAAVQMQVDELEKLAALNDAMADANEPSRIVEINAQFHRCIHGASKMPALARLIEQLWIGLTVFTPLLVPGRAARSVREHEVLLRAFREGDGDSAALAMREHIGSASQDYLDHRHRAGSGVMTDASRVTTR
jgi:DNA-binding GntR family transcriptional regulator